MKFHDAEMTQIGAIDLSEILPAETRGVVLEFNNRRLFVLGLTRTEMTAISDRLYNTISLELS